MKTCVFDIETDGLLEDLTKIHCLVLYDVEEGKLSSFIGEQILDGLFLLKNFDTIIGHNILGFDLLALKSLFKWKPEPTQKVRDTLVWSRLVYPDRAKRDFNNQAIDKDQYGRHSLKSWGQRLNFDKGEFTDFEELSDEMVEYHLIT